MGPIGTAELAEAVSGFIEDIAEGLEGRQRFHAKVAMNALAIIARADRSDAPAEEIAYYKRRTGAAAADACAAFCKMIRAGDIAPDDADTLTRLARFVAARLAIDNPSYSTLSRLQEDDRS